MIPFSTLCKSLGPTIMLFDICRYEINSMFYYNSLSSIFHSACAGEFSSQNYRKASQQAAGKASNGGISRENDSRSGVFLCL